MDRPTVLVTGMSGLIGGAVRRQLGARYELSALNRRAVDGVPCHQADIADLDAIQPAFKGVDAVVHLAASVGTRAPFDEVLRANVVGTYNVFEAARRAGPLGSVPHRGSDGPRPRPLSSSGRYGAPAGGCWGTARGPPAPPVGRH